MSTLPIVIVPQGWMDAIRRVVDPLLLVMLLLLLLLLLPTEPSLLLHMHNNNIICGGASSTTVDLDDDLQLVCSLRHLLALSGEDLNPTIAGA